MGEADHQTIRDGFEAFNEQGTESMLAYVAEDVRLITPAELSSEPGTWEGHDGLRAYWDSFYEVMEEIRTEPENLEDAGDWVVGDLRVTFKGKGSGIEAQQIVPARVRLADGKLSVIKFERTREECIAAALAESG